MLYLRSSTVVLPPPAPGAALAGYGWPRAMTASHGELAGSLLLLSDDRDNEVLLGSIDTLFVSRKLLQDLQLAAAMPNLILFATHTHNAPSLAQEVSLLGGVDAAWYAKVLETFKVSIQALRETQPTRVSVSYGEVSRRLNVNRRKYGYVLDYAKLFKGGAVWRKQTSLAPNTKGTIDSRIRVFSFEGAADTRAIIWSFAAHPAFYPQARVASADFPGLVREQLRALYGDQCCIVYIPGLGGSAIPRMRQRLVMRPSELMRRLLPFHPMLPSYARGTYLRWVSRLVSAVREAHEHRRLSSAGGTLTLSHELVSDIFADTNSGSSLDLRAAYLGFGANCGILAYSGEMLGEWSEHFADLPLQRIIASGYAGGDCLYVPPADQLPRGGYEVDGFQPYFGLKGRFREDITDRVLGATRRLLANGQ